MGSSSKGRNTSLNIQQKVIYQVPEVDYNGMERIVDETFGRYLFKALKRNGKGISIVWFRNDLRVLDNEVLFKAWVSSEKVLPVYCVDPRLFQTTYYFGFQKTGGMASYSLSIDLFLFATIYLVSFTCFLFSAALRAQFLMECLADLRTNLMNRGLNLLIQHGRPEEIIPSLAESFGAHTVE